MDSTDSNEAQTRAAFERIMVEQPSLALATLAADGSPDVRVVNFCWRADARRVYFSSFADNEKVRELGADARVAFTTIPVEGNAHVRARGICRRSALTVYDVVEDLAAKEPGYRDTVERFGDALVLFEVELFEVEVTIDLAHPVARVRV